MKKYILLFIASFLLLVSCTGNRTQPDPIFTYGYVDEEEDIYDGQTSFVGDAIEVQTPPKVVKVPFKEDSGVRTLQVKINDCAEFPMIFDTGCSGVSISLLEFTALKKHGYISESDIVGTTRVRIADGSISTEEIVNLHKIQIGDYICYDVEATISENIEAPLLLGNGALKDVKSFVVDDKNKVIEFNLY